MKKFVLSLVAGVMATSIAVSAASTINFEINGTKAEVFAEKAETKTTAHPIYVPVDKSYISADDVKTFLGADVEILDAENAKLTKNGSTYTADGCTEKDGVFYIPLRKAAEMAGFDVEYIYSHNSILISDKPAAVKVNGKTGVSYDQLKFYYDRLGVTEDTSEEVIAQAKQETVKGLSENAIIYQTATESGFSATMVNDEARQGIKERSQDFEIPVIAALENEKLVVINVYLETVASVFAEPTDEEIEEFFNENYITAKHILVLSEGGKAASDEEAKKEAERILKQVKAGKDFDALMKEFGEDLGVEYNPDGYIFTKGEMVPEFEAAAYALEEGEVSELVKTSYGYHIIKRVPMPQLSDSVKATIAQNIRNNEYSEYVFNILEKATVETNDKVIASIK